MAPSEEPNEARELALVNKVEMRIALADTDEKVQAFLKTYLAPLLLKLASSYATVRNKVLSVCQHIHKRIKPQSIQLPVQVILKQYKDQSHAPLVRRFDMVFIEHGIRRLPTSQKEDLIPVLLHNISIDSQSSTDFGARLFQFFLELLPLLKLPPRGTKEDDLLREKLQVTPEDAKFLSMWLGKLLLLNTTKPLSVENGATVPGLSAVDGEFLTMHSGSTIWRSATGGGLNLVDTKISAVKFIASGAFTNQERFLPGLIASVDLNYKVSEVGNDIVKRLSDIVDLEDQELIIDLYNLYLGSGSQPASPALKSKILSLLCKSKTSTAHVDQVIRVVREQLEIDSHNSSDSVTLSKSKREMSILWSSIFTFLNHVARVGSHNNVQVIAPQLLDTLMSLVDRDETVTLEAKAYIYEAIALLSKASPSISIEPSLSVLSWFLNQLVKQNSNKATLESIEEGLVTLLGAYEVPLPNEVRQSLGSLLLQSVVAQLSVSQDSTKSVNSRTLPYNLTRYANRCLPFDDMNGRWIDVLAITFGANGNNEAAEEGRRGLDPYWHYMLQRSNSSRMSEALQVEKVTPLRFPEYVAVIQSFFEAIPTEISYSNKLLSDDVAERFINYAGAESLEAALRFARLIINYEALTFDGSSIEMNADVERFLCAATTYDLGNREKIKQYIKSPKSRGQIISALKQMLNISFSSFSPGKSFDIDNVQIFIDYLALSPTITVDLFVAKAQALEPAIMSNTEKLRMIAGQCFGILASRSFAIQQGQQSSVDVLTDKVASWASSRGEEVNRINGALLALAFFYSRLKHRDVVDTKLEKSLKNYFETLFLILKASKDKTLLEGCFIAIRELSTYFVLNSELICTNMAFEQFISMIKDIAITGNDKAITTLGRVGMVFEENDQDSIKINHVIEQIRALHEIKQIETQFSVGEALTCAAAGWQSETLVTALDIDGDLPNGPSRQSTLQKVVEAVLADCFSPKPSLKKAALVWLLCFLQFCGHTVPVQKLLWKFQYAFKLGLTNHDEFIQETASRGLGMVYKMGSQDIKADLVKDLITSFSDNKKTRLAGSVTDDTQLFEPGMLPTGDGSVTTYKDIMSLAAEVGNSGLVYRFMSLASNNALWSSRVSYGKFAMNSVFADEGANKFLIENPKLYTKLYRYRYDPNPNVQRSMRDIWNALIPDTNKAIEENVDNIMEDLLQNSLIREWRARQASLNGMSDLIQGRKQEMFQHYLLRVWEVTFKVLDDIKESVRTAAGRLAKVLTALISRNLEARATSSPQVLTQILPFLLSTSGLESSVKEVQAFALNAILEITKKSDSITLQPFVPEVIDRLARLLSSMEPQAINYVHLNADKYKLSTSEIDDMRLKSVRGSPLMEAIERCLDYLDENAMGALYPRLEDIMKTAVGLPSKVGLSRILVSLSTRHNMIFSRYADKCLRLLAKYIMDRNDTVSSSYAAAAGYVSRKASAEQILKLLERCKSIYFDSDNERSRMISGEIIQALHTHASDRFNALAGDILPFVFFAKADGDKEVREIFDGIWNDAVGGPRAVRLHLGEILALIRDYLDSNKWDLKHSAARATAKMIKAIVKCGDISTSEFQSIWPIAEKSVDGKSWDGKETVLESFIHLLKHSRTLWQSDRDITKQIKKIAFREARRQNYDYRQHSVRCLGEIALLLPEEDMASDVMEITAHVVQNVADTHMELDSGSKSALDDPILMSCVTASANAINPSVSSSSDLSLCIERAFTVIHKCNQIGKAAVQSVSFDTLRSFFERLKPLKDDTVQCLHNESLENLFDKLFYQDTDDLHEAARLSRVKALRAAAEVPWPGAKALLQTRLPQDVMKEKSPLVRKALEELHKSLE